MMDIDTLKKLGLSETEASIFLLLIENGPATFKDIAKKIKLGEKETKMLLQKIISKKHITPITRNNITYFYANHHLLGIHF